jgi:hypothetical protein
MLKMFRKNEGILKKISKNVGILKNFNNFEHNRNVTQVGDVHGVVVGVGVIVAIAVGWDARLELTRVRVVVGRWTG